eukprot:g123.t1
MRILVLTLSLVICNVRFLAALETCDVNDGKRISPIVEENKKPGSSSREWDINGAGDPTIQGFATKISVDAGEIVHFKIKTDASLYRIDIYRMGYYQGLGARKIVTIKPSVKLPQTQPECFYEPETQLVDCASWQISASWQTTLNKTISGIYFARLVREDKEETPNWRTDNSRAHWDFRFSRGERDDPTNKNAPEKGPSTYKAHLGKNRSQTYLFESRASHIYFVVREDSRHSDIVLQTMDSTWQAYNCWGSVNTYAFPCDNWDRHAGSPQYQNNRQDEQVSRRAFKASLNRPYATRAYRAANMPFNAEYPLVRWLEKNGYDVSYIAGVDLDRTYQARIVPDDDTPTKDNDKGKMTKERRGSENSAENSKGFSYLLDRHKVYISSSHDEYWSLRQRRSVEFARDHQKMHLIFLTGNEMYWKIRWEPSPVDHEGYRTMVVYKDSQSLEKLDPVEWTGTWRDARAIRTESEKAEPENSVTGSLFTVNAWRNDHLEIPSFYKRHRIWRNTIIPQMKDGEIHVVPTKGILGHEWNEDIDNGFRPPGLQHLSATTVHDVQLLMDQGSVFDTGSATHHLVMYRSNISNAIVFGAGTCQWAWANHHSSRVGVDQMPLNKVIEQATVNVLSDMGIIPFSIDSKLVWSLPSDDHTSPTSFIKQCKTKSEALEENIEGGNIRRRVHVVCEGFARDTQDEKLEKQGATSRTGVVTSVEYSKDYGTTWHPCEILFGQKQEVSFYCEFVQEDEDDEKGSGPDEYSKRILTRAVDDSGNLEPFGN